MAKTAFMFPGQGSQRPETRKPKDATARATVRA